MEPNAEQFIHSMGTLYCRLGYRELYGRFIALMLLNDGPVTLAAASKALGASKSALSGLVRPMLDRGDLKLSSSYSSREHGYTLTDDAFTRDLRDRLEVSRDVALACREAAATPGLSHGAIGHLRHQAELHTRMVIEAQTVIGPLEELQAEDLKKHLDEDWDALPSGPDRPDAA